MGLFDELGIRATFFVLGWVAERLPNLIKKIYDNGHEIASHGFWHNLCSEVRFFQLREELLRSKELLQDITGVRVLGFRAPNFSICKDLLALLKELGYVYDSSYNSFRLNSRYGELGKDLIQREVDGIFQLHTGIFEIPISNFDFKNIVLPAGGGAYFRIYPLFVFKFLVKNILKQKDGMCFICIHGRLTLVNQG